MKVQRQSYLYRMADGTVACLGIVPAELERCLFGTSVKARLLWIVQEGAWVRTMWLNAAKRWRRYVPVYPRAGFTELLCPLPCFVLLLDV